MEKWIFGIGLIILFSACTPISADKSRLSDQRPEDIHFDLYAFIDQEINRLSSDKIALQKKIFATKQDSTQLDKPDWSNEIIVFKAIDTKNPSIQANYTIDTTFYDDGIQLHWHAIQDKAALRSLTIRFQDHQLIRLELVKHQSSFMMEQHEFLVYQPQVGFSIQKESRTPFSESHYLLESTFLYP